MSELTSIHINQINGLECLACGNPTLMLDEGGYVTCVLEGCPEPDFAKVVSQLIADSRQKADV